MPWVKALLSGMFGLESVVNTGKLRFIVIDGSTIQEPGANSTTYRLHIAIDLISLSLYQVEVTTDKKGENLDHYTLGEGDVVLIDRGYNQPKTLVPFIDRGGDIVLRYNAHGMNLYEEHDNNQLLKVDWHERLQTLDGKQGCIPVYLKHDGKRIQVYLHAIPLAPKKAEQARRNARQRAKKKGNIPSDKTLYLSEWTLIISSLPETLLDTQTVGALYRVRWQVERVIKRLKTLLDIDKLRAYKHSLLAELYIHGKLLYTVALEKLMHKGFGKAAMRMDKPRQLTPWRLLRTVADDVLSALKTRFVKQAHLSQDAIKSLSERPRKRKLQGLPPRILALVSLCREIGVSYL